MKAIILAGGVGSRLRPMTCDCPKPMVPVLDKPVMEYTVQLLKRHGAEEIAATLCYLPEQIRDYFGDGSRFGVSMRYYVEKEPLGTAGGVKMAQEFLDETFFVLSGDGLTDCDLSGALRFHREKGAMATIVLKEAAEPTEYGVAVTEKDGRIRNFLEKPDWSDVLSDMVNTGIYILEPEALRLVPEGVQTDFSRDLFPKLMRAGMGVYGYKMQGYWCDIGDVGSYLGAHRAFLSGEIALDPGFAPGQAFVHEKARVAAGAKIEGPCYIGPGAVVEQGAVIAEGSAVGCGAKVCRGAQVKRGVLWPGAVLEPGAQASGCVVCTGAVLEEGARAYEGAVIGEASRLGAGSACMPGVRIWPRKQISERSKVERDVVWGSGCGLKFRDGKLRVQDPAQALRFAQAYAERKPAAVVVGCADDAGSIACMQAVCAGLSAGETRVLEMRSTVLPVLREFARAAHADAAVFCAGGTLFPLTGCGAPLPCADLRKMEKALCQERAPAGFLDVCHAPKSVGGAWEMYLGGIAAAFEEGEALRKGPAAVFAPDYALWELAAASFERAGRLCRMADDQPPRQGETMIRLDGEGKLVRIEDGTGAAESEMLHLLMLWAALEAGERWVALTHGAPDAAAALCSEYGAQIDRVHSGEGEELGALGHCSPLLLRMRTDGVYAALHLLSALERSDLRLWDWQKLLPRTTSLSKVVPVAQGGRGRVLRSLAEEFPHADLGDGVRIRTGAGRVWVRPSSDSAECLISCEAADMETAQSLLGEYAQRVLDASRADKTRMKNSEQD